MLQILTCKDKTHTILRTIKHAFISPVAKNKNGAP